MKYVYILRSIKWPERLYIGVSDNPQRRLIDHNTNKCLHTKKFKPWRLAHEEGFQDSEKAFLREKQIKRWKRVKKEALIAGDEEKLKKLSKRNI